LSASGRALDDLAALEEELRFLLRSIDDLERERAAGDVDDADYHTLRDGYTVRAAAVLRQIDEGTARLARPRRRRGPWRSIAAVAVLVVLALGIGFALASAWGERSVGQEITGLTPGDEVRTVLVAARQAMRAGDFAGANQLFAAAIDLERERGIDNPEAIAYFGWTLALLSVAEVDEAVATERLDAAELALSQAIVADPRYPDPHCFLAIVQFQFRDDPDAALPSVEACAELDPPAEVADLIDSFADEIRAATS
jgi:tetratricopeptide (TPR) repeat protein